MRGISTIHTPLIILNKKLQIKSANRAFYKTFQVNEKETEGKLIFELGNKQWDIPALRILLEQVLPEQSKILDYEVKHTFQTIGERIMLLSAQEIRREEHSNKLILLAIEDITEKKKSEELFKKSNEHFRNLVKNLPAAVYSCNLEGIITFYNDSAEKLWGRKPDSEKDRWSGTPKIYSSNGKILPRDQGPMALSIKNNVSLRNQEIIFERPDGSQVNVLANPQPEYNLNGERIGSINILIDITERIIAQKKALKQASMIENLLMTAPGFVCTLKGPKHIYDLVNSQYQQIFGNRKLKGLPILEAIPELIDQEFESVLDKVYTTGEPYVGIDIPISFAREVNSIPQIGYFNFSYQPMYDEDNNIFSILVFGNEVTEQVIAKNKNLQDQKNISALLEDKIQFRTQELSNANELLNQKNLELESFTFVSSHDLQEPLRKIQTFSSRILEKERDNLSENGKDYFQRMQSAAERMQTLIDDLLSFSRINTSERKFVQCNLKTLIDEVMIELQDTILEKNAIIEIKELCEINIIPFQFRQLINNLISNSLKFSSPNIPPRIIINCCIEQGSNLNNLKLVPDLMYTHLSFTDNGIGFEQDFGEKIFEVFQKLHRREEYSGTGIGLAIVKKIVETHNGIITVKSELGKGSTFNIYIPADL